MKRGATSAFMGVITLCGLAMAGNPVICQPIARDRISVNAQRLSMFVE
jgi:hypothetical protein